MPHACERVLVIEDDAELRQSILEFLELEQIEPLAAATGDDALELLRRGPLPDVILLDLSMPGVPGPELLRRLQADPRWAKIPVAVMSGFARNRFAYVGPAVEYLEKPFDLERLNHVLSKLCAKKAKTGTD